MCNLKKKLNKKERRQFYLWLLGITVICVTYLFFTSFYLYKDKTEEERYWTQYLTEHNRLTDKEKEISKEATRVKTGVYLENIDELDIKNSNYTVNFKIWFAWKGEAQLDLANHFEIYRGKINEKKILENQTVGQEHYQLVEVSATINKVFWTTRFPLGSYQLRMYVQPQYDIKEVVLLNDQENSSMNTNMNISGFTPEKFATSISVQSIKTAKYLPGDTATDFNCTEFLTAIEINRKGLGLYIKCFIALVGTLGWVLITLFICTYHEVDPLGMIPSALFGTVSNILVGANLVPDAIQAGLVEFVNIYGIMIIIFVALAVIKINRTREYYGNNELASILGKRLFWTILFFTLVGNLLLPLVAYRF